MYYDALGTEISISHASLNYSPTNPGGALSHSCLIDVPTEACGRTGIQTRYLSDFAAEALGATLYNCHMPATC
jgi:hypothetical protein